MARVEEEIAGSNLLIKDPALTAYLRDLIGKVGGPAAKDMRIYLARIPDFNAVMFPTGFAVIFSGLLLRMRNEAQLAGVIAHESGPFPAPAQIRQWRDMRRKTDIFSIGAMVAGRRRRRRPGSTPATSPSWRSSARSCRCSATTATLEAEADAMGARLLAENGYPPIEMANTWEQLIGEEDASARHRRKRRDRGISLFATHPSPEARMADLQASARAR